MSLVVRNLELLRGERRFSFPSFSAEAGSLLGVVGPSGSGKSTLLSAIAGFLPVEKGEILVGGAPVTHLPPEKRRTAMVFQKGALFPHLSLQENVEFALRAKGEPKQIRAKAAREWLERMHLLPLADRRGHQVSGGEAQRALLARALIARFPVLLLDEPFSGLDSALRAELRALIATLVKEEKIAALLVTHDPEDVQVLGIRSVQIA